MSRYGFTRPQRTVRTGVGHRSERLSWRVTALDSVAGIGRWLRNSVLRRRPLSPTEDTLIRNALRTLPNGATAPASSFCLDGIDNARSCFGHSKGHLIQYHVIKNIKTACTKTLRECYCVSTATVDKFHYALLPERAQCCPYLNCACAPRRRSHLHGLPLRFCVRVCSRLSRCSAGFGEVSCMISSGSSCSKTPMLQVVNR